MNIRVATTAFFALLASSVCAQDILILRDGSRQQGEVRSCRDECVIGTRRIERRRIVWVGLEAMDAQPPAAKDIAHDEVHLIDGRVVTGEFGGMSRGAVAIGDESFDRDEVAWIRFAGPEPAATPTPSPRPVAPIGGTSRPSTGGSAAPPSGRPSSPPSPRATRPPSSTPRAGDPERGALWTGTYSGTATTTADDITNFWECSAQVRLREWKTPLVLQQPGAPRFGTLVRLLPEGTVVTNRLTCSGQYVSCSGQGTITLNEVPDETGASSPSVIYLKDKDIDTTSALGFNVPRQGGLYVVGWNVRTGMEFPVVWRSPGNTNTEMSGYVCPLIGNNPLDPDSQDRERRSLNGGRMQGAYSTTWHDSQLTATWSICREGTVCPPPPTAGGEGAATPAPDPCGDMAAERALVDVIWDQRQSMLPSLERDWRELAAAQQEVMFNVEAWSAAVTTCGIEDIVTTVVSELSGDFGKALDLIQKITSGDLSYLNQSDDVSTVLQLLDAASSVAGAGDPANMRDRIAGCAGLPQNLRDAANAFVDNYEKVRQLAPRVQQQLNQFRAKDQQYWDRWQQYYRKCLEYAQCKNLPSSTCPAPPSTPSGPMPR